MRLRESRFSQLTMLFPKHSDPLEPKVLDIDQLRDAFPRDRATNEDSSLLIACGSTRGIAGFRLV
jgi:hypothetical protein